MAGGGGCAGCGGAGLMQKKFSLYKFNTAYLQRLTLYPANTPLISISPHLPSRINLVGRNLLRETSQIRGGSGKTPHFPAIPSGKLYTIEKIYCVRYKKIIYYKCYIYWGGGEIISKCIVFYKKHYILIQKTLIFYKKRLPTSLPSR